MKSVRVVAEWADLHYTLRMTLDESGYSAEFELFSMVCLPPGEITYPKKGWQALPSDSTSDLDSAQACASGWIKWDGCTEFDVKDDTTGRHHVCGTDSMTRFTTALNRIYDVAQEHIPHWLWP